MLGKLFLTLIPLACAACKPAAAPEQGSETAPVAAADPFPEDTVPVYDSAFFAETAPLNDEEQLRLFRSVMQGVRTTALYDFSQLKNEMLLPAYKNLEKTLQQYQDSTEEKYSMFFNTLYRRMEMHEQEIGSQDTLNIRTRLEIARVKSAISSAFALRKSGGMQHP